MGDQGTFGGLAWTAKKKTTRREQFLVEMDRVVPWKDLVKVVAPHYPVAGRGRRPMPLEQMLRIYFVQQWFDLSDPMAEDAIYDSESIRRFVGVDLSDDAVPDETTICRFRHLLEEHQLTVLIFEHIRDLLTTKGLLVKSGTIVDATIINAPSSTKNATETRDPEMRQTRKGKNWYFGMKIHVGTDPKGLVHSITTTHAAAGDITQFEELLHGDERVVYGDQAYWSATYQRVCESVGLKYRINRRAKELSPRWRAINRARSRRRARGEHAFHVVKRLWGFTKVRYRGLAKNTARAFTAFALANLYLMRKQPRLQRATCLR